MSIESPGNRFCPGGIQSSGSDADNPGSGHCLREITPNRPGPIVAVLLGVSEAWNDYDRHREAAEDKPTGGNPLFETRGTNRKRESIRTDRY